MLTQKELEIIRLVAIALTNRQIASAMLIKEQTVKNHLVNIFRKLGLESRAELMLWAIRQGVGKGHAA